MPKFLKFLALAALLTSCALPANIFDQRATIHYVGESLAPTATIETFYDEQDVKRTYRVIGRMTNDIVLQYLPDDVKQRMQEKAREVGGDAIIVTDIMPARVKEEVDKIFLKATVIKYI